MTKIDMDGEKKNSLSFNFISDFMSAFDPCQMNFLVFVSAFQRK
jgi:hypothetical protein